MFKPIQIAALFVLLVCGSYCQAPLTGMISFNPRATHIENSCFMVIQGSIQNSSITISQSYRPSPSQPPATLPQQCRYFNFVFESLFYNEQVNYVLNYQNSTDPTNFVINATLDGNAIYALNGTACVLLPQTEWLGIGQYLCKMVYDTLPLYIAVWGYNNFTFDTNRTSTAVWPLALEQQNDPTMQANWLGINTTFPSIVVYLFDSCGSNSNISSLSSKVVVTTPENLTATLPGVWLAYTIIKPMGQNASNYSVVVSNSNATLFDTWFASNCWDLGIMYSALLPDLNYCANGCQLSFVVMNARKSIYVLESTGLFTNGVPGSGNGGNGGNNGGNNGSSNGTGNGTNNNGTGNGNGNGNGGAASSALTIGINMVLMVLVSFVYWL